MSDQPSLYERAVQVHLDRIAELEQALLRHHEYAPFGADTEAAIGEVTSEWQNAEAVAEFCGTCRRALTERYEAQETDPE